MARRHSVNTNLLFTWQRQEARKALGAEEAPMKLFQVTVTAAEAPTAPVMRTESIGRMEVVLADGQRIIIGATSTGRR